MAGRPTKLNPAVQGEIINAISIGATYKAAAEYAGVTYDAFNGWMVRGEKEKRGMYFQFFQSVTAANAKARVTLLAKIQKAATDGEWRAAAWILERRFKDEYGEHVTIAGDEAHPLHVFDHNRAIAGIAPRSMADRDTPGADEGDSDGTPVGEDIHGG